MNSKKQTNKKLQKNACTINMSIKKLWLLPKDIFLVFVDFDVSGQERMAEGRGYSQAIENIQRLECTLTNLMHI